MSGAAGAKSFRSNVGLLAHNLGVQTAQKEGVRVSALVPENGVRRKATRPKSQLCVFERI